MINIAQYLEKRIADKFYYPGGCGFGDHAPTAAGLATGIQLVDNATGGLQPGSLTVVAGRPGFFKKAFILQVIRHLAVKKQEATGIMSLSSSAAQLVDMLVCLEAGLDLQKCRLLGMDECLDVDRLEKVTAKLRQASLFIDDAVDETVADLEERIREAVECHSLSLMIIDHLELTGEVAGRPIDLSSVLIRMKQLARKCDIPFLVVADGPRDLDESQVSPLPGKTGHQPWIDFATAADYIIAVDEYPQKNRDAVRCFMLRVTNNIFCLSSMAPVFMNAHTMELREQDI